MKSLAIREKFLTWLTTGYFFGYLSGAIIVTFFNGFSPQIYSIGFMVSLFMMLFLTPLFIILALLWVWAVGKYPKLDDSWLFTTFFSLVMGVASLAIIYLWLRGSRFFSEPVIMATFFGGFLGALLPRILIKPLRHGSLMS